jgi:hypothetical protein
MALLSLVFAVRGGVHASDAIANRIAAEKTIAHLAKPGPANAGLVRAPTREQAEAAALHRLSAALTVQQLALTRATAKPSANAGLWEIDFEASGAPDNIFRALYQLEKGPPAFVLLRLRMNAAQAGAQATISATARGGWSPVEAPPSSTAP